VRSSLTDFTKTVVLKKIRPESAPKQTAHRSKREVMVEGGGRALLPAPYTIVSLACTIPAVCSDGLQRQDSFVLLPCPMEVLASYKEIEFSIRPELERYSDGTPAVPRRNWEGTDRGLMRYSDGTPVLRRNSGGTQTELGGN